MSPKNKGSVLDQEQILSNFNESRTTRKSTNLGIKTQLGNGTPTKSLFDSSSEQNSPVKAKNSENSLLLRGPNRLINGYVSKSINARPRGASSEISLSNETLSVSCSDESLRVQDPDEEAKLVPAKGMKTKESSKTNQR